MGSLNTITHVIIGPRTHEKLVSVIRNESLWIKLSTPTYIICHITFLTLDSMTIYESKIVFLFQARSKMSQSIHRRKLARHEGTPQDMDGER